MDILSSISRSSENSLENNMECGFVSSTTKKANLVSMISLLQVVMIVFMLSLTIIKTILINRTTMPEQPVALLPASTQENNMVEVDSSYKGRHTVLIETGNLNMADASIAEYNNPPFVSPYTAPENINSFSDSE